MFTLVVNPGSTGTKFKVFNSDGENIKSKKFHLNEEKKQKDFLLSLPSLQKIVVRVVHGGNISEPSKISKTLKKKIKEYEIFAPIHNKRSLILIHQLEKIFPKVNQYACFDTAFHTSIPEHLYTYAIPKKVALKYNIRRYGFHGLAVQSAVIKLKKTLQDEGKKVPRKIIVIHLGGGCSVTAVKNGLSFCTSMGLTPLSGVMMTQRSGDIDSSIYPILNRTGMFNNQEITNMLQYKSGFLGLTQSVDTAKIFEKAKQKKPKEKLAFDIFISGIIQAVFGFAGHMQGLDAVVFTGGIGYGNSFLRKSVIKKLSLLNITTSNSYHIDVDEEILMFNLTKNKE